MILAAENKDSVKEWVLARESELRIEIDPDIPSGNSAETEAFLVKVKLVKGTAELFGSELALGREYSLRRSKVAIFTWHGCTLQVTGRPKSCHDVGDTPMPFYAKLHMVLQARRQDSTANHKAPPVVLLIGGPDCGKTALARLLINYSVRQQDHVLLVDLRPFGNCISLPGCIGAGYFRRIIDAEVGEHCLSPAEMLFYLFCGTTPPPSRLYERQVELLAQTIQTKHQKQQQEQREQKESLVQDKKAIATVAPAVLVILRVSSEDVNPRDFAINCIRWFAAEAALVIGNDKLFWDMKEALRSQDNHCVPIRVPKSGGVVTLSSAWRVGSDYAKIRRYFYGTDQQKQPSMRDVKFAELFAYSESVGPLAPTSALPIGHERKLASHRMRRVVKLADLNRRLLAVTFAKEEKGVSESNIAGFVYVSSVDLRTELVTLLTPNDDPLPSHYMLMSSAEWADI